MWKTANKRNLTFTQMTCSGISNGSLWLKCNSGEALERCEAGQTGGNDQGMKLLVMLNI